MPPSSCPSRDRGFHPHEPQLDVDVDHSPVRREAERQVRVALAVLVERLGAARAVLARPLDGLIADQVGD